MALSLNPGCFLPGVAVIRVVSVPREDVPVNVRLAVPVPREVQLPRLKRVLDSPCSLTRVGFILAERSRCYCMGRELWMGGPLLLGSRLEQATPTPAAYQPARSAIPNMPNAASAKTTVSPAPP